MRLLKKFLFGCLILGSLLGLLALPATTRQGVNFKITTRRIPWVIKAMDFVVRDYEYRDLAARLTQGLAAEETKTEALLRWTHDHIRPVPPGCPIVDDHISHTIIRGYGEEDQMADVFTALAAYSGIRSFWKITRDRRGLDSLVLSFAKIDGRWTVWDVAGGVSFRDADGRLLSVEELERNPELLQFTTAKAPHRANLYRLVHAALVHFEVSETLRTEKQMPIRRVLFELRQALRRP